jgi:hypothetical protein
MHTQLAETTQIIEARIHRLIDALLANYNKQYPNGGIDFDIVKGTKYYKLVEKCTRASSLGGGTSVHAFIGRQTGSVYKPASWKAPAKHVRYNLLDDVSFETCIKNADWAGSYLYMK